MIIFEDGVDPETYKLDLKVKPLHYFLRIEPDIKNLTTNGSVQIQVVEKTSRVTLHSSELDFEEIKIIVENKSCFEIVVENILIIALSEELPIGDGEISIRFQGKISKSMSGLYLSTYNDDQGRLHECLVTQFEPTDARQAFPCFDEPHFKATFQILVVAPPNKIVLSNTSLVYNTDGKPEILFQKTAKMSTYLVALIVGDFDSLSTISKSGIKVGVYVSHGNHNYGMAALKFYNEYFGIPYPLPKMDMVSISDFALGAMENWGLVTYREDLLLVTPTSSQRTIKNVHLVIAHELAHQWFGNLVTMMWWNDLWLNEGFANWIEYLAVDRCNPDLNIWKSFVVYNTGRALELDSLNSSHPIEIEIKSTRELDDIFDDITYSKGASIIAMMYDYIGDEAFKKGMNSYFNQYQYSNVQTKHLWQALEQSSQKPVSKLMTGFTQQMGYPLLENSNRIQVHLKQRQFLLYQKSVRLTDTKWCVPISYCIDGKCYKSNNPLDEAKGSFSHECNEMPKYLVINPLRIGYYRVLYSKPMLDSILANLSDLPFQTRLGIMTDYFSFCKAGFITTSSYLDMVNLFRNEMDEEVLGYIIGTLHNIYLLIHSSPSATQDILLFNKFCNVFFKPILKKIGLYSTGPADKSDATSKLICSLLGLLLHTDPEDTGKTLKYWFEQYINKSMVLHPDYRVYVFSAAFSCDDLFDKVLDYFSNVTLTEEKIDILRGISGIKNKDKVQQIYEFSFSEKARPQDSRFIYSILGSSPYSSRVKWPFLKNNYQKIVTHYANPHIISRIVKDTVSDTFDQPTSDEIRRYFREVPNPPNTLSLSQSLESISINTYWFERDSKDISAWLSQNVKP